MEPKGRFCGWSEVHLTWIVMDVQLNLKCTSMSSALSSEYRNLLETLSVYLISNAVKAGTHLTQHIMNKAEQGTLRLSK